MIVFRVVARPIGIAVVSDLYVNAGRVGHVEMTVRDWFEFAALLRRGAIPGAVEVIIEEGKRDGEA